MHLTITPDLGDKLLDTVATGYKVAFRLDIPVKITFNGILLEIYPTTNMTGKIRETMMFYKDNSILPDIYSDNIQIKK